MRAEILLMLVAIGLGTYALRALPLIGARRLDPAGEVFAPCNSWGRCSSPPCWGCR